MCQNCGSNNCTTSCRTAPKVKMVYCVQQPSARYTVNIKKIDKCSLERIPGACIKITDQYGRSAEATTNRFGLVSFSVERCTSYTITEECPAPCYVANNTKFALTVDDCGKMTLNGKDFNQQKDFIVFENIQCGGCSDESCCDCNDGMICYVLAEMPQAIDRGGCSCCCNSCSPAKRSCGCGCC